MKSLDKKTLGLVAALSLLPLSQAPDALAQDTSERVSKATSTLSTFEEFSKNFPTNVLNKQLENYTTAELEIQSNSANDPACAKINLEYGSVTDFLDLALSQDANFIVELYEGGHGLSLYGDNGNSIMIIDKKTINNLYNKYHPDAFSYTYNCPVNMGLIHSSNGIPVDEITNGVNLSAMYCIAGNYEPRHVQKMEVEPNYSKALNFHRSSHDAGDKDDPYLTISGEVQDGQTIYSVVNGNNHPVSDISVPDATCPKTTLAGGEKMVCTNPKPEKEAHVSGHDTLTKYTLLDRGDILQELKAKMTAIYHLLLNKESIE